MHPAKPVQSTGFLSIFTGTIKRRLTTQSALFALLLVCIGGGGLLALHLSDNRLQSVFEDRLVPIRQLSQIENALTIGQIQIVSGERRLQDATDKKKMAGELAATMDANIANIYKIWAAYSQTLLTPEEKVLTKAMEDHMKALFEQGWRKWLAMVNAGEYETLYAHHTRTTRPLFDQTRKDVEALLDLQVNVGRQEQDAAASAFTTTFAVLSILALGGIAFSVFSGRVTSRAIAHPMENMIATMGSIANGKFDNEIRIERFDEIGQALQHLVGMQEKLAADREAQRAAATEKEARTKHMEDLLKGFDVKVGNVLTGVSSASTQLQSTAGSMSATAEETSKQAGAVASASEQASANVQTVASAAEELSSSIAEISRQVGQSSKIAGQAVADAEKANQMVQGLAGASQKIGDVVALITDIAEQTNLLALNATIEAARAGEAGKGFAVVAAEVKNLANQTAKATDEIGGQITGIQSATQDAVKAIETIGKTIGEINEIASAIAAAVEQQGAATQEIARNVEQAAVGTQEVSSNITGVNQAANDTGSAAGQVLSAAQGLAKQSGEMKTLVEGFLNQMRAA